MIAPLVRPVPVVSRYPYHVPHLQLHLKTKYILRSKSRQILRSSHLPVVCWFVGEYGLLLVFLLAAVIPDVVQRLEPGAGVGVLLLHDLVGDPADLTAEGADEVVGEREQVDILDHSAQGTVGVPGNVWFVKNISE